MIDGKNKSGNDSKNTCKCLVNNESSLPRFDFARSSHFQFALIGFLIGACFGALILAIITKIQNLITWKITKNRLKKTPPGCLFYIFEGKIMKRRNRKPQILIKNSSGITLETIRGATSKIPWILVNNCVEKVIYDFPLNSVINLEISHFEVGSSKFSEISTK